MSIFLFFAFDKLSDSENIPALKLVSLATDGAFLVYIPENLCLFEAGS